MRFVFFYKCYRYFAKSIHNSAPSTPQTLILASFERGDSHKNQRLRRRPRRVTDDFRQAVLNQKMINSFRIAYFLFYREPKWTPLRCLALRTKCQPLHGVHPITLNKKEQYPTVCAVLAGFGELLRRWLRRRLKSETLTIQTTPKSAPEASMVPSCGWV